MLATKKKAIAAILAAGIQVSETLQAAIISDMGISGVQGIDGGG